jgi:hypothetical protein
MDCILQGLCIPAPQCRYGSRLVFPTPLRARGIMLQQRPLTAAHTGPSVDAEYSEDVCLASPHVFRPTVWLGWVLIEGERVHVGEGSG